MNGFVETQHGVLFLIKLSLVAIVLLIALANRNRLTPRLAAGDVAGQRSLGRNIRVEIGLIAVVLLVTALLGHTTPPRAIVAMAPPSSGKSSRHLTQPPDWIELRTKASGRFRANVALAYDRAGANTLEVAVVDETGRTVLPIEVKAQFAAPDKGVEPSTRTLARGEYDMSYRLDTSDLSLPGRWTIRVDALITDFEKAIFEAEVSLR